jgi:hypothetical protein
MGGATFVDGDGAPEVADAELHAGDAAVAGRHVRPHARQASAIRPDMPPCSTLNSCRRATHRHKDKHTHGAEKAVMSG